MHIFMGRGKKLNNFVSFYVLGKQIIATNDIERLRKLMLKLRSGIYLLKINTEKARCKTAFSWASILGIKPIWLSFSSTKMTCSSVIKQN